MKLKFAQNSYICPHCHAYAGMERRIYVIENFNYGVALQGGYGDEFDIEELMDNSNADINDFFIVVKCRACNSLQFWIGENMIYPENCDVPEANTDMPGSVKEIYDEAARVYNNSPRASAALLRLAIQILCKELGEKGDNLNEDIGNLVKKGLSPKIQQALDSIRVVGNNAVHPGKIEINDNKKIALSLFKAINLIIKETISDAKEIGELYELIPDSAKKAIEKRDFRN